MKKMFIAVLFAAFIGTTAFEAPITKVSHQIHHEFKKSFNNAKEVTWKSTDKFTEAVFTMSGEKQQAFYTNDGEYMGATKSFAFDKLPQKGLSTILKKYNYPVYELKECIEYKNAYGDINYYISFEKNNKKLVVKISPLGNVDIFKAVA